ncbi:Sec-independent protein translocase protein TatB [Zhongshania sp.]|uniref:Sec-independent protein translocase protein TatB n=1 Tax=Zhongshania sp. TaxID=1971902 RepID=UPI0035621F0B
MFDIGFAELLVLGVLGLLVIGPERLPGTVRTIALWTGRLRRSFSDIRSEIEREVGADEIRRQLHNESILASLKESKDQLNSQFNNAGEGLRDIENSITPKPDPTATTEVERIAKPKSNKQDPTI